LIIPIILLQMDPTLIGLLGRIFFGILVIIILFLASGAECYQSKGSVSSEVPEGFHRLLVSESFKTKMTDNEFPSSEELYRRPIPGVSMSVEEVESSSSESKFTQLKKIDSSSVESMPMLYKRSRRGSGKRVSTISQLQVKVLRGGEFIGNRMRFKVKIVNESPYIITDVTVYLLSYPKDALRFVSEDDNVFFSKIEPGGFRSPTFDFLPTQDCVK